MMNKTTKDWLWERIGQAGERPFLLTQKGAVTYDQLAEYIENYTRRLEALPEDACMALCSDFSLEGVAALLACARRGLTVAPMVTRNPEALQTRMREGALTHKWVLRDGVDAIEAVANLAEKPPLLQALQEKKHPGLILFSSGSSGTPKSMLHDFANLLSVYKSRRPKTLRLLAFLLFDHIGGLHTLFGCIASQAALVVPSGRDPESVAEAIARERVAVLPASPSFLSLLLMSGALDQHDLTCLRIISYGTEPMPEGLLKRLRKALPKARFIQTFGTSETGISQTISQSSGSLALRIDDPHTRYKIVDGELWLKSDTQIMGYLNTGQERFTPDGWFRTGDLVEELDDGYLRIHGRSSDVINVGGEKVFPAEVESVVMELSGVGDCLALASPNPITGQAVMIQVAPAAGMDPHRLKSEIRRHCREHLERYKCPARIQFVEKTSVGDRLKRNRRLAG